MDSFLTRKGPDFVSVEIPVRIVNIPWRNNNLTALKTEPPLSEQAELVIGVYLLLIGCLSWVGNSIVIYVLYKQRASLQPTDYLTLNLAVSDACISMFGYSRGIIEIFDVFHDNGFIIKWVWTCQVDGFFTLLFGLVSINTLTAISVTRYIKGCHPNRVYCIRTSTINVSLMCVWAGAFFWAMLPLAGWGSYTDHGYGTCEIDWNKANYSTIYKSYIISILFSCFLIPVLVMLFSYGSIISAVKTSNAMSADGYLTDRQRKVERDVTRVSIIICTAFIMAWAPYAMVSMWSAWGYHVPKITIIVTRMFAKSASFYNPLIYFGMSSKFRRDVYTSLPCTCKSKDVVRLRSFNHLWHKDAAAKDAAAKDTAIPIGTAGQFYHHQGETKYAMGQPLDTNPPTGLLNPPHTPPPVSQEINCPLPTAPSELAEYETDRL